MEIRVVAAERCDTIRWFGTSVTSKSIVELHGLGDASPKAYGETLFSTLRQRIWITQGRREVKRIIRKCVTCQRQHVGPCGQKMGPLPEERVTPSPPFSDIGIDFAGPLYVKERTIVKKTYVCLFTCALSRMVHLELTNSLTTDEFLQAFSRMTSRRGLCGTVC